MERNGEKPNAGALAEIVGRNLHGLRTQRDLTLDGLSRICGVSRAMLWQIERARSAPTITVLSRVAEALGVPVSTFLDVAVSHATVVLRKGDTRTFRAEDGSVAVRALFPQTGSRYAELHELRLQLGAVEAIPAKREGTFENVVVTEGSVQVELHAETPHILHPGDAMYLRADSPHGYRNVGAGPAVVYRVTLYPTAVTYE